MLKLKVLFAGLATAATMVFAGTAAATTSDSCLDFGLGQNNCFAATSEDNVDFAIINMGRWSYGSYTLVCSDRHDTTIRQGRIGTNGRRFINMESLGLRNPDCTLTAHANNSQLNKPARVGVTLVD